MKRLFALLIALTMLLAMTAVQRQRHTVHRQRRDSF